MKKVFILLLFLITFTHSWSKADDIRDFQIEGMSIGDSLLKFYNKKLIEKKLKENEDLYNYKKSKTFRQASFSPEDSRTFEIYEYLQFMVKRNDSEYIIHGISGKIFGDYNENIDACYDQQDKAEEEIKNDLVNLELIKPNKLKKHPADKSGKSTVKQVGFFFNNDDVITIECYKWSKTMDYLSNFKITVATQELNKWWYSKN
tara:strand:+ start:315 stop:923 length:609 start_codon:yes stop_codon:yes gene_type:complete